MFLNKKIILKNTFQRYLCNNKKNINPITFSTPIIHNHRKINKITTINFETNKKNETEKNENKKEIEFNIPILKHQRNKGNNLSNNSNNINNQQNENKQELKLQSKLQEDIQEFNNNNNNTTNKDVTNTFSTSTIITDNSSLSSSSSSTINDKTQQSQKSKSENQSFPFNWSHFIFGVVGCMIGSMTTYYYLKINQQNQQSLVIKEGNVNDGVIQENSSSKLDNLGWLYSNQQKSNNK